MNRQDIAYQVSITLGDHIRDFDLDAIVDDLGKAGVKGNVDDIDSDTYWETVRRHDVSAS